MGNKDRIDVHCHLFDGSYILSELKEIWHAICEDSYPFEEPELSRAKDFDRTDRITYKSILETAKYFLNIGWALLADCNTYYGDIKMQLERHLGTSTGAIIVPLMMDVFYMYAYSDKKVMPEGNQRKALAISQNIAEVEEVSDTLIAESIDQIIKELKEKCPIEQQGVGNTYIKRVEEELRNIFAYKKVKDIVPKANRGTFMTSGYKKHMEELEKLKRTYKDAVFPFLAVDPRRPGIMELVREKVGTGKPFHGIKLYTRLGYLPSNKVLSELFEFCCGGDIPITSHCNIHGFPGDTWESPLPMPHPDFADPGDWEDILKKYPDLRINFAHFGGEDRPKWQNKIISFMDKYPNVYADLAYYADDISLQHVKALMEGGNKKINDRIMFGTDYTMILFNDQVNGSLTQSSLDAYFLRFKKILSEEQLDKISIDNPSRFLRLGDMSRSKSRCNILSRFFWQ